MLDELLLYMYMYMYVYLSSSLASVLVLFPVLWEFMASLSLCVLLLPLCEVSSFMFGFQLARGG